MGSPLSSHPHPQPDPNLKLELELELKPTNPSGARRRQRASWTLPASTKWQSHAGWLNSSFMGLKPRKSLWVTTAELPVCRSSPVRIRSSQVKFKSKSCLRACVRACVLACFAASSDEGGGPCQLLSASSDCETATGSPCSDMRLSVLCAASFPSPSSSPCSYSWKGGRGTGQGVATHTLSLSSKDKTSAILCDETR